MLRGILVTACLPCRMPCGISAVAFIRTKHFFDLLHHMFRSVQIIHARGPR